MKNKWLPIFFSLIFSFQILAEEKWITDVSLCGNWKTDFKVSQMLYDVKTDFQHIQIFENEKFGKILALDGLIQITEKDEFIYHELLVHVPLMVHGNPKQVLIIGGGDGGALREVLRYKTIESVCLVEIDKEVIQACRIYMPKISKKAFEDMRVEVMIQDGAEYIKNTEKKFDIILCDTTEIDGIAATLFTEEFYANCKNVLNPGGIMVCQMGVPFCNPLKISSSYKKFSSFYQQADLFLTAVPSYSGGFLTFIYLSNGKKYDEISKEKITEQICSFSEPLMYYNADIHFASFVLPEYLKICR